MAALIGGQRGTINVGAGPTWLRRYLPRAIARLHAAQPNVAVRAHTGTHDLLIPALREASSTSSADRARRTPLARRSGFDPAALLDFPWIVPLSDVHNRDILGATFRRIGMPMPKPAVEAASVTIALRYCVRPIISVSKAAHYLFSPEAAGTDEAQYEHLLLAAPGRRQLPRNIGTMTSATRLLLAELRLAIDHQ